MNRLRYGLATSPKKFMNVLNGEFTRQERYEIN